MGNKSDQAKSKALEEQNRKYQESFQQQTAAWKPSPYEEALNKEGLDWLNATNGAGPKDVAALPGMSPYIDIFNTASAKQQGQRYGLGSLKMGAELANPNMLAALAQQDESHRRQDAGAQLEGAYRSRNAEVRGMAMPVINIGENRAGAKVGAAAGMAQNANSAWANHRVGVGFWGQLLQNAVGGAAQGAASAGVTAAAA